MKMCEQLAPAHSHLQSVAFSHVREQKYVHTQTVGLQKFVFDLIWTEYGQILHCVMSGKVKRKKKKAVVL